MTWPRVLHTEGTSAAVCLPPRSGSLALLSNTNTNNSSQGDARFLKNKLSLVLCEKNVIKTLSASISVKETCSESS